jgi:hypothetical protein
MAKSGLLRHNLPLGGSMSHRAFIPLLIIVIAVSASASIACLNDTAVRDGEDEFRSRYETRIGKDAPAASNQVGGAAINPWGIAGLAVGSGLIAGSSVAGLRRRKRQGV